jgi:hypothetical protein
VLNLKRCEQAQGREYEKRIRSAFASGILTRL